MVVKARARVEVRVGETVRVTVRAWQQGHLGVLVRVGVRASGQGQWSGSVVRNMGQGQG